ncbi:MAG: hypothetical protein LC808_27545 [Actinobacteria bacterium]|nr:hypothetical protein [Actinomycetota bacterium]
MSSDAASRHVVAEVPAEPRPWAHLSTDQLLDRLEWSYGESGGFEPEVVWELARRATQVTGAR